MPSPVSLRSRLDALRRTAVAAPASGNPDTLASLKARIERMRARSPAPSPAGTPQALAGAVGGTLVASGLVAVETRYALPCRHGAIRLDLPPAGVLPVSIRKGDTRSFASDRILMLDTETSGLAGGTGTLAFLVGLAAFEADALVVRQYLAATFAAEAPLLRAVGEAVRRAGCIVTFNGKSFDVPLLRTRFALARLGDPFGGLAHADLLHATRRRLKDGWIDCRLRTTEEEALGFARTDDLPGAEVPEAWQRWLRHGDATPVPRILAHNREDLLSLAALLHVLAGPTAREAPLLHGRPTGPAPAAHL